MIRMHIGVNDISSYVYCPVLQARGRYDIVTPILTEVEQCVRRAIINGEHNACLKDSIVTSRKLLQAWDEIWWRVAAKKKLSIDEANRTSLQACCQISDYCKYDISDWMMPTVGTEVETQVNLGAAVLKTTVDIIKVDLSSSKPCTILINFVNHKPSPRQAATNPAVKATAYAFHSGRGENITHMLININERSDKIDIVSSTFRQEDMQPIRSMLEYIARGIASKNYYHNPWHCKECKVCQDFTL